MAQDTHNEQLNPEPLMHSSSHANEYQPQWDRWTRQLAVIILLVASVFALTLLRPVIPLLTLAFLTAFIMFEFSQTITMRLPIPHALVVVVLYGILVFFVMFLIIVFIPEMAEAANDLARTITVTYGRWETELINYVPGQYSLELLGRRVDFDPYVIPIRNFLVVEEITPDTAVAFSPGRMALIGREVNANLFLHPLSDFFIKGNTGVLLGGLSTSSETVATAIGTTSPPPDGSSNVLEQIDIQEVLQQVLNVGARVTGTLTSAITGFTGVVATVLMALFISFLIVLDMPRTSKNVLRSVPKPYHREYLLLMRRVNNVWTGFFRGQVAIGIIIGGLTWAQLRLMGIAGAEVLAVLIGIISLIPTIGGFIALIPLSVVPLLNGSSVYPDAPHGLVALLVVGINLLITQVIWNVVAPKILGDALDLPLPVILVGVFIGAAVGGVLGAFLVAPIMGTVRVMVEYTLNKITQQDPFPGEELPAQMTVEKAEKVRVVTQSRVASES